MDKLARRLALSIAAIFVSTAAFADDDDVRELQRAAAASKITLTQAIETAEREVAGGKTLEIELKWTRGGPRYEVELLVGETWKEVRIDAVSGKVLSITEDIPDDADDRAELRRDQESLAAATRTFAEVIAMVEKESPDSRITEIELTTSGGKTVYKVERLHGSKINKQRIAAAKDAE